MEWACEHCGRTYDEPPADDCVSCGHTAVAPADGTERDPVVAYLGRVRRALLDPRSLDTDLASGGPAVAVAFRLVLAVSLALLVVVAAAFFL